MNFTLIFKSNFNEHSAVAEIGDRLVTIDMGQKLGGCDPLRELGAHLTQYRLGRGLPSY